MLEERFGEGIGEDREMRKRVGRERKREGRETKESGGGKIGIVGNKICVGQVPFHLMTERVIVSVFRGISCLYHYNLT